MKESIREPDKIFIFDRPHEVSRSACPSVVMSGSNESHRIVVVAVRFTAIEREIEDINECVRELQFN